MPFHLVHIVICITQQGIGILPIQGVAGDTDTTGRHSDRFEFGSQWLGHDCVNLSHLLENSVRRLDVRQQHGELIAAQS